MALLVAGCGAGAGPREPRAVKAPQVAWLDKSNVMHIAEGADEHSVEGWEPYLWLPNGDLFAHTPDDSAGMGVYRVDRGEFISKLGHEWGDAEFGLGGIEGMPTSRTAVLHVIDDHDGYALGVYDFALQRTGLIELPAPPDDTHRIYRTPVRVGSATLIAFYDQITDGDLDKSSTHRDGVILIRDGRQSEILKNRHVEKLFLSSDGGDVLAVATTEVNGYGDDGDGDNYGGASILDLDPATGAVRQQLDPPQGYSGRHWFVDRADKIGSAIGVQLSYDASADFGAAPPKEFLPLQTWQHDGSGWSKVAGTTGREVYWQSRDACLSWVSRSESEANYLAARGKDLDGLSETELDALYDRASTLRQGPIEYDVKGKHSTLAPSSAFDRVAAGSLLRPAA